MMTESISFKELVVSVGEKKAIELFLEKFSNNEEAIKSTFSFYNLVNAYTTLSENLSEDTLSLLKKIIIETGFTEDYIKVFKWSERTDTAQAVKGIEGATERLKEINVTMKALVRYYLTAEKETLKESMDNIAIMKSIDSNVALSVIAAKLWQKIGNPSEIISEKKNLAFDGLLNCPSINLECMIYFGYSKDITDIGEKENIGSIIYAWSQLVSKKIATEDNIKELTRLAFNFSDKEDIRRLLKKRLAELIEL